MKIRTWALAALLLGAGSVAGECKSVAEPGLYIGGSIGYSTADIDQKAIENGLCGGSCASYSDDEQDLGFKAFAGYLFNNYFAVEAGYFNVGTFTYEAASATDSMNGEYKMDGANLDLVLHLPVSESVSLMARGGVLYGKVKEQYDGVDGSLLFPGDAVGSSYEKSDVGFKYGVGIEYNFHPNWGLRGDVDFIKLNEGETGGGVLIAPPTRFCLR